MRSAGKLLMRPCEFIPVLGRVFARARTRFAYELRKRGLRVETHLPLPMSCDGVRVDLGYRLDQRSPKTGH